MPGAYIPGDVTTLSFNAALQNVPSGETFVAGIDDTVLFSLDGRYANDATELSGNALQLDISEWSGQDKNCSLGSSTSGSQMSPELRTWTHLWQTIASRLIRAHGSVPEPALGCLSHRRRFFCCAAAAGDNILRKRRSRVTIA